VERPICCFFSVVVKLDGGRIVAVYPAWQIVVAIVACVTIGFTAPGVRAPSG
jgi:hypothetical protein